MRQAALAALAFLAATAGAAAEIPADPWRSVMWEYMAERHLADGPVVFDDRVRVAAPASAENQFEVPVTVDATALPGVTEIVVLADLNPVPHVLTFTPVSAAPYLGFRIKLEQASVIHAAARTADGTWHVGGAEVDAAGGGCTTPARAHSDPNWMRHIGRTWSVEEAAQRMSRSSEFQRGYGRLGDDEFVHQLYRNTLSRDADRNGADFWANRLGRRSDRAEIALAFADSAEFTRRTEAANYVATAFLATTGRVGSPRAMAPFVEQVEDGAYKVQVIEDIALTARPASWWNRVLG